jgi:hypothetical protein
MAVQSTKPLIEMITRNISWGKDSRCVEMTAVPTSVLFCLNLGVLASWNPKGLL